MRRTHVLTAAAVTSLLAFGPLAASAGAAERKGVGTGSVSATTISVQIGANGDVLSIRVLGDDGASTTDPAKGKPAASTTLRPLTISSKTAPALNLSLPPVTTSSGGAEDKQSVQPALPSNPAISGTVNAVLSSVVDAAGARSGLAAGLANLKLVGGLVNVPTGAVQLASSATPTDASGSRMVDIPDVRVLDLSALLEGLGLKLTDLSVDQVLGLLKSLGITLPAIADPAAAVAALNQAIDVVKAAATGPITAQLCNTVDGLLRGPLGGITGLVGGTVTQLPTTVDTVTGTLPSLPPTPVTPGGGLGTVVGGVVNTVTGGGGLLGSSYGSAAVLPQSFSCSALTGTVADLLDTVQNALGKILAGSLVELGETALLSVKDVKVGLETLATDAVETSKAKVTASIGQVRVGNLPVPGVNALDLGAPTAVLEQAQALINGAIGDVLSTLNASLGDLVKVETLDIDELVSTEGAYTTASTTVTALRATLTPPSVLGAALIDLQSTPVKDVLGTVSTTVPAIAPLMSQLEATLGGLDVLTAPAVVTVGQLTGNAAFRPVSAQSAPGVAPSPDGELPRTGSDAALPAMMAVALGGAALAIRRVLRSATM